MSASLVRLIRSNKIPDNTCSRMQPSSQPSLVARLGLTPAVEFVLECGPQGCIPYRYPGPQGPWYRVSGPAGPLVSSIGNRRPPSIEYWGPQGPYLGARRTPRGRRYGAGSVTSPGIRYRESGRIQHWGPQRIGGHFPRKVLILPAAPLGRWTAVKEAERTDKDRLGKPQTAGTPDQKEL